MEKESEEISIMLKIRKTILKMLEDRGYSINQKDLTESYESFKEKALSN